MRTEFNQVYFYRIQKERKQKTNSLGNKIYCDTKDNSAGGVDIGVKKSIDLTESSFDNDNLPGSSIFIDNTGWSSSERFGAFILGPKTKKVVFGISIESKSLSTLLVFTSAIVLKFLPSSVILAR